MAKKDVFLATIHERIAFCVQKYGEGKNTIFAEKMGVSEGNIRGYIKGVVPKADFLEKIVRTYDVSPEWLLTGEGEMFKTKCFQNSTPSPSKHISALVSEDKVTKNNPYNQTKLAKKLPEGSHEGLPLIPLSAVAGFPAIDETGVFIESCERYRIPEFEAKGAQFLIRVSGDSMIPTYQNGDIIACRKLSDILFFQWGNIYVIDSSQGQLVKRIFECPDNAEHIRCVSDNTKYPPFNIPTTDIRSLSIIIGLLRIV